MTIAEKIKLARKNAGLTQMELSKASGIAYPTIQKYEGNKYIPRQDKLKKLANALKVPVQYFRSTEPNIESAAELATDDLKLYQSIISKTFTLNRFGLLELEKMIDELTSNEEYRRD